MKETPFTVIYQRDAHKPFPVRLAALEGESLRTSGYFVHYNTALQKLQVFAQETFFLSVRMCPMLQIIWAGVEWMGYLCDRSACLFLMRFLQLYYCFVTSFRLFVAKS